MRRDINFQTHDGLRLNGWLYSPKLVTSPSPVIVMSHGFAGVKELYLDKYAETFFKSGFVVVVYDHRNYGDSEGLPRFEIDPVLQIRDFRDAITYATTLENVDASRIGIWGSSYSGGHVLKIAAYDRRVKCVVAQVPDISGSADIRYSTRADLLPDLFSAFETDRANRFCGAAPAYIPIVSDDPAEACALPGNEAYRFITEATLPGSWENRVTLKSVEMLNEYEPGSDIARISPTPLLMIVATEDTITVTDLALEAYQRALPPKDLVLIKCGHFSPYVDKFNESSTAACDFFAKHLF